MLVGVLKRPRRPNVGSVRKNVCHTSCNLVSSQLSFMLHSFIVFEHLHTCLSQALCYMLRTEHWVKVRAIVIDCQLEWGTPSWIKSAWFWVWKIHFKEYYCQNGRKGKGFCWFSFEELCFSWFSPEELQLFSSEVLWSLPLPLPGSWSSGFFAQILVSSAGLLACWRRLFSL